MGFISSTYPVPPEDASLTVTTDTDTGAVSVTMTSGGTTLVGPDMPANDAQIRLSKLIAVSNENKLGDAGETYTNAQKIVSEKQDAAKQYQKAAEAPTGTPNKNDLGGTAASGDQTGDASSTQSGAGNNAVGPTTENTNGTSGTQNPTNPTGKNVNTNTTGSPKKPVARPNPLGSFSSYTYNISLYMITPDAHNAFVAGGRKNLTALSAAGGTSSAGGNGVYLIAQSGGTDNSSPIKRALTGTLPNGQSAPGFELDYYIDNLKFKSFVSTTETRTSGNLTDISFDIIEPYGFSLPTKLRRAHTKLVKESKIEGYENLTNGSKQFFVLGLRFQGYDKDGNIVKASDFPTLSGRANTTTSGVFESFYSIMIKSFKFKINGTATTYHLEAQLADTEIGMTTARSTVENTISVNADTVENALTGTGKGIVSLFTTLNANEAQAAKNRKKDGVEGTPNEYKIRWVGDAAPIRNAKLNSKADTDKSKQAMSNAGKESEVNDKTAKDAAANSNIRRITIDNGTSIMQAINNIIKQSSYLEAALKVLAKSETSPNSDTNSLNAESNPSPNTLRWFNISPEIKVKQWDTTKNDFSYEITYVIQPYETPAAVSPYGKVAKYYGPHKRYDYWFTGKNTEVLGYTQTNDNTYFITESVPDTNNSGGQGNANVPTYNNKRTGEDKTGKLGQGMEVQNTYMTSLFDPSAYANSKIEILGDPDFLMVEAAPSINDVYSQFYQNDNFTINPNGGQVFVEVDFKEAIDYSMDTGLMSINESIYFWDYPASVANVVKGVSYKVLSVTSILNKGKFTQVIDANINTFPELTAAESEAAKQKTVDDAAKARTNFAATDPRRVDNPNQTTNTEIRTGVNLSNTSAGGGRGSVNPTMTPAAGSNTSTNSGLTSDKPVANNTQTVPNTATPTLASTKEQTTTPTNNVNNPVVSSDESAASAGTTQSGKSNLATDPGGREEPPNP